jgi:hypothetical protein
MPRPARGGLWYEPTGRREIVSSFRLRWLGLALAAALCTPGPAALAHTTVQSTSTEGVRADNALRIGHGCEEHPVVAQSVVFPTDAPQISTSDSSVVIHDLAEVITQGSVAGLVRLIQSRDIFTLQTAKLDANGNTIGFTGTLGWLVSDLVGRVPFDATAPNFVAESCATALRVEIAIADICGLGKPTIRPEKVNLWIPANGSQFANEGAANGIDGVGSPARWTIQRNLASNPLPDVCNGAGYTVTVTPSPQQVDRDLPIGNLWRIR